jgi:plasmid stabilization system protein ParE
MKTVWLNKATQIYLEVIDYLENNFSDTVADRFVQRVEKCTWSISKHPFTGHLSVVEHVRYRLIDDHGRLYYEIYEEAGIIYILGIFDTRQDPAKNQF